MTQALCRLLLHFATVRHIGRSLTLLHPHDPNKDHEEDDDSIQNDTEILQLWTLYILHTIYTWLGLEVILSWIVPFYYPLKLMFILVTFICPSTKFPNFWFETFLVPFMYKIHDLIDDHEYWTDQVKCQLKRIPWILIDLILIPGIYTDECDVLYIQKLRKMQYEQVLLVAKYGTYDGIEDNEGILKEDVDCPDSSRTLSLHNNPNADDDQPLHTLDFHVSNGSNDDANKNSESCDSELLSYQESTDQPMDPIAIHSSSAEIDGIPWVQRQALESTQSSWSQYDVTMDEAGSSLQQEEIDADRVQKGMDDDIGSIPPFDDSQTTNLDAPIDDSTNDTRKKKKNIVSFLRDIRTSPRKSSSARTTITSTSTSASQSQDRSIRIIKSREASQSPKKRLEPKISTSTPTSTKGVLSQKMNSPFSSSRVSSPQLYHPSSPNKGEKEPSQNSSRNHNKNRQPTHSSLETPSPIGFLNKKLREIMVGDKDISIRDYLFDLNIPSVPSPQVNSKSSPKGDDSASPLRKKRHDVVQTNTLDGSPISMSQKGRSKQLQRQKNDVKSDSSRTNRSSSRSKSNPSASDESNLRRSQRIASKIQ